MIFGPEGRQGTFYWITDHLPGKAKGAHADGAGNRPVPAVGA